MDTRRWRLLVAAPLALCLIAAALVDARAMSLRPGKSTDDSACDLAPKTNQFIDGSVLIPSGASWQDKVDAYFRLAGQFVALKCRDGQLMIVQGFASIPEDSASPTRLANESCLAATVVRTEISIPFMGNTTPGFEVHCMIAKREELGARLAELERTDPMDALKARLLSAARASPGAPARAASGIAYDKKDCVSMTLASLLQGGGCK